jgi:hypothetical protein
MSVERCYTAEELPTAFPHWMSDAVIFDGWYKSTGLTLDEYRDKRQDELAFALDRIFKLNGPGSVPFVPLSASGQAAVEARRKEWKGQFEANGR